MPRPYNRLFLQLFVVSQRKIPVVLQFQHRVKEGSWWKELTSFSDHQKYKLTQFNQSLILAPPAGRTALWASRPDQHSGSSVWRICRSWCWIRNSSNQVASATWRCLPWLEYRHPRHLGPKMAKRCTSGTILSEQHHCRRIRMPTTQSRLRRSAKGLLCLLCAVTP